ncbi:transcriptional repressor DicA [compost metagenome]|jgi:transcriptional regulator with XRE-family HTH domain
MDTIRHLMATRLKHLRKSKGFKQAELAEVMGCEINTISRYETGANTPSIDQLLRLAEALGVSPMEILPPPNPTVQRVLELRQDLAEKALQIDSPKGLEQLVQLANELISASRALKK